MSGQSGVSVGYTFMPDQVSPGVQAVSRNDGAQPYCYMDTDEMPIRHNVFPTDNTEGYQSYTAYNASSNPFDSINSSVDADNPDNNLKVEPQYVYSLENDEQSTDYKSSENFANLTFNDMLKTSSSRTSYEYNNAHEIATNNAETSQNARITDKIVSEAEQSEQIETYTNKDSINEAQDKPDFVNPDVIKIEPLQNTQEKCEDAPIVVDIKQEVIFDDEVEDSENAESDNESSTSMAGDSDASADENDGESSEEDVKKSRKKKMPVKKRFLKTPIYSLMKAKQEFKCDICYKIVTSKRALEKHVNLHTGKFSCGTCGKHCNSQMSLDNHIKVHKGFIGNEKCNVCDKTFYDKSSLNKHTLSVHMGIKHFKCEYCEMSFYAKKTYVEHVRVHTGERPFKCELCPKSYKRVSDLNHHVRLHKGEVSHTCEFCGEGYRRSSELRRHMQKHTDIHTPIKPAPANKCDYCNLKFSTMKALRQHLLIHMDGIDVMQNVGITKPQPDQFTSEKLKLVDNIVLGLGSGSLGERTLQNSYNITKEQLFAEAESSLRTTETTSSQVTSGSTSWLDAIHQDTDNPDSTRSLLNINPTSKTTLERRFDVGPTSSRLCVTGKANCSDECMDKNVPDVNRDKPAKSGKSSDADQEESKHAQNDTIEEPVEPEVKDSDADLVPVKQEMFDIEIEHVDESSMEETETGYQDTGDNHGMEEAEAGYQDTGDNYGGDTEVEDYDVSDHNDPEYKPEVKDMQCQTELTDNPTIHSSWKTSLSKKKKRKYNRTGKYSRTATGDKLDDGDDKEKSDASSLVCQECGKRFAHKNHFKKHMNLHTGVYTCGHCSKSFSSQYSLDLHIDKHEGRYENTAKCNVCDKTFYDVSSLNKHIKSVHMNCRPFSCPECDRKFSERKTMVEHIRVHTGERPYQCQICGRTFKRHGELNFHMKKHTGETKLTCNECGEGFRRQSELRNHMIIKHDGERPFVCSLCGKGFMSNSFLQEHLLTHAEKSFECDKCGKGFHSRSKLTKHHRIKTDCAKLPVRGPNGNYTCRYCLMEFFELKELNTHLRNDHDNESGKRRFNCQVCSKEFGRMQSLRRHMKIHTQTRDYKCTVCQAAFIQKHHLAQHIRTHTGEKPYECAICHKKFAQTATLYSHMKHH